MNYCSNGISNDTMVSIICIAYNHEKYISKAIDGFLMQKTNFKYEILIHEDASTDNTAKIIKEYELQYPDIIKIIYQKENQYSKGVDVLSILLEKARGKYLAFCEGDDYWINCNKLQIQVDFLENNKNYSAVFHNVIVVDKDNKVFAKEVSAFRLYGDYSIEKCRCLPNHLIGQLGTLVCINYWRFLSKDKKLIRIYMSKGPLSVGDIKINLVLNHLGNIYHMHDIMSCYRRTYEGDSFNARTKNIDFSQQEYNNIDYLNDIIKGIFKKECDAHLVAEAKHLVVENYFIKFLRNMNVINFKMFTRLFCKHQHKYDLLVHFIQRICKFIMKENIRNKYKLQEEYFESFKKERTGYEF